MLVSFREAIQIHIDYCVYTKIYMETSPNTSKKKTLVVFVARPPSLKTLQGFETASGDHTADLADSFRLWLKMLHCSSFNYFKRHDSKCFFDALISRKC